jgi:ubiquinol-cytochrome c reductase iron-sulfur subunit
MWDKKPLFITHRTPAQIIAAQNVDLNVLIDPQEDVNRVKKPEWLVTIAICTHSGCVPNINKTTAGGLICPCHGSEYDTSHRIRQGPAAKNLAIPPYRFITNDILQIGKQV